MSALDLNSLNRTKPLNPEALRDPATPKVLQILWCLRDGFGLGFWGS